LSVGMGVVCSAGAESTVIIDFYTDPAGDEIDASTRINDVYTAMGVGFVWEWEEGGGDQLCGTYTKQRSSDTDVYAAEPADDTTTDPNAISACNDPWAHTGVGAVAGYIVATFDAPVRAVCIDIEPESNGSGELIALAFDGSELSSDQDSSQACVSGDDDIWGVKFSGVDGSVTFDTLAIVYGPIYIDFDHRPDGQDIASGEAVNDVYESQGVLFSLADDESNCGADDTVYANGNTSGKPVDFGSDFNAVSACSPNSPFSLPAKFNGASDGVVVASFFSNVLEVCVDSAPEFGGEAQLIVRGESGEALGDPIVSAALGEREILCSGPRGGIRSAEFAGVGTKRAIFDDFSFEFGGATVNFDEDPVGQEVTAGTDVRTVYESLGVTFAHIGEVSSCAGEEVRASANVSGANVFGTPPNVVTPCPTTTDAAFSEVARGLVEARFAQLQDSVCIDVRAFQGNARGVMRAFDDDDLELEEVYSDLGAIQSLCVAEDGIRSVQFAGAGQSKAYFDDLRYTAVPEPSASLLRGAALAAIALMGRARARRGTTATR
ncbi:MAG: hypothetical protein JRG96_21030, partial [Deltaproteobacteria bacterium]|nr:hypothetical protein [Deltaproteobacteria bacterium]